MCREDKKSSHNKVLSVAVKPTNGAKLLSDKRRRGDLRHTLALILHIHAGHHARENKASFTGGVPIKNGVLKPWQEKAIPTL